MNITPLPRGIYSPVLTPFTPDLEPDTERFIGHCKWLLAEGCNGLVLFGTTSEANSLSVQERLTLTDAVVEAGIAPHRLIIGSGLSAIPESVRLTAHAAALGCAGVLMLPPFYYKGQSDEGLARAYAEVIDRVSDPRLRVYLYHIPKVSGVAVTHGVIERLLKDYEDIVVGIKDSSGDWDNTRGLLEAFPGFGVFPGSEAYMLDAMKAGAHGCITATANIAAGALRHLYDGWQTPQAEVLQEAVTATRLAAQSKPMIPGLKAVLARRDGDDGWLTMRPPLMPLDEADSEELFAALQAAGFDFPQVAAAQ
jgi:4-hydroxy-tetrahydrodipicolinate synthase